MSSAIPAGIHYQIIPYRPLSHLWRVRLFITEPAHGGEIISLPAWIPGSYMIRNFARHIVQLSALRHDGRILPLQKIDKQTWRTPTVDEWDQKGVVSTERSTPISQKNHYPISNTPFIVEADIYAKDDSVRGSYLDTTRGFFNGTSVFFQVKGREKEAHSVEIIPLAIPSGDPWRIATTLPIVAESESGGWGLYLAENYATLIDHPVSMGHFQRATFDVSGTPHEWVQYGRYDGDLDKLCADLKKVCATHIDLFHAPTPEKIPFSRYMFHAYAGAEGYYGGLEHCNSTVLAFNRDQIPYHGMKGTTSGYRGLLSLASHEYFHSWMVKRIRPEALHDYDLERENYTHLLWAFEGFTSYYDDLSLVRSQIASKQEYLDILRSNIQQYQSGAGRKYQSLSEASLDAWIKYYYPNENSPNANISYYLNGSLLALCIDLRLRSLSVGKLSLDDVMRKLWEQYGSQPGCPGVPEDGIEKTILSITPAKERSAMSVFLQDAIYGVGELPLAESLATVGIRLTMNESVGASLGIKSMSSAEGVRLQYVYEGGAAQLAGLSAGDILVACNGLRMDLSRLDKWLLRQSIGDKVKLHFFRGDVLIESEACLGLASPSVQIRDDIDANEQQQIQQQSWLWQPNSSAHV